jgi:uncharacterized membrane protein YphA (DoxX/SURF4 family)
MMAMAAGAYLTHAPKMVEAFTHLGYPLYFMMILGTAKLLGVIALLLPRLPRLKEWAYAGFVFTLISAFISHLESGDGSKALAPVVALVILTVSCLSRPASRTFPVTIPIIHSDWHPDFSAHATKPASH